MQSIWNEADGRPDSSPEPVTLSHLGWVLGSAAVILFLAIALTTYFSIRRSEDAMSGLLAEKGASLLMVFESALRTGMRSQVGLQLQPLLEEMTRSPDIEFVALTMPDGIILAHSDRSRIGDNLKLKDDFLDEEKIAELDPGDNEKWKILHMEGKRIFLLYRHFNLGTRDWTPGVPMPTIFLGMDISPFEITNSQNRSYVIMLGIVILLVGIACLLAMCYAQRASEFRKKQHLAESEVVRLENEMRRQEKLAAVGTLAAGVAHEIRNPLSSIKGYATYFRQRFPEGSEDRDAAGVMLDEVNRLNRVISDLLGLSAQGKLKIKKMAVANVVEHVQRLLRHNAKTRNIQVVVRLAPQIPMIMADIERLSQAVLNLCLNAFDAMPQGGVLTLAVSGGKRHICLMVCDTGCGIAPEILNKIFDPYFTTKGTGTGLGLAMVHKIIRSHNGEIDVVSHPAPKDASENVNTIFRIWLPAAD